MSKEELLVRIENNHKHHPPATEKRIRAHEQIRVVTADCARALVALCPESRELSLALTNMELAMMWANASVARQED
jgi:hypothetical protein